jgi:hypothetical protein
MGRSYGLGWGEGKKGRIVTVGRSAFCRGVTKRDKSARKKDTKKLARKVPEKPVGKTCEIRGGQ